MTANDMIARSASHTEIVHAAWTADLADALLCECEDSTEDGTTIEYWGTDEDGAEWRVHLAGAPACLVEIMPDHLISSHKAAGNWGRYPDNGADRKWVSAEEAEAIVASDADGYARIVRTR